MTVWKKWHCYEVSDDGRIRRDGHELTLGKHTKGYQTVTVCIAGKASKRLFHGIVLEAFKGDRPTGKQARHLNGVKTDNRPTNLVWGTQKENEEDKLRHGTRLSHERHPRAKVNREQVDDIRQSSLPTRQLAKIHRLSQSQIQRIRARKAWV